MKLPIHPFILFFVLPLFYSCSNLKYLPEKEMLFTGSEVTVSNHDPSNQKLVIEELEKIVRPSPNKTFFGLRTKLWFYHKAGKNAKKGIKKFMKTKLGEAPVFLSVADPEKISDIMTNRLINLGYFNAKVHYEIISKDRKAKIKYQGLLNAPFIIQNVVFPSDTDILSRQIKLTENETFLKKGQHYDLDNLKKERIRIESFLKDTGFYFFNSENIIFKADSTRNKNFISIALSIKPECQPSTKIPYSIDHIYIMPYDTLDEKEEDKKIKFDTTIVDGFYYLNRNSLFKPKAITRNIVFKSGDLFSRTARNQTTGKLMGMGIFKFVSIKFVESKTKGKLDVFILLTPATSKSLQFGFDAVTKSNNYTGGGLNLSYKNKNLLKGAESLVLSMDGLFEAQLSGSQKGQSAYEFGANSQFFFPKILPATRLIKESTLISPKTKINLGFKVLSRPVYFNLNATNFSYGYLWKKSMNSDIEINPLVLNFSKLSNVTSKFENVLIKNPSLRKKFREQFTIGSRYAVIFHSKNGDKSGSQYSINTSLDLSGNSIYLLQTLLGIKKTTADYSVVKTEDDYFQLFNYRYSQYIKLTMDTKYFYNLNTDNKIALRFFAGAGIPFANSNALPFIMQFFSGGPNSIRAFPIRKLGPGSYFSPDSLAEISFIEHAGDIKLEWNIEYRFPIISVVKGALFSDIGNVWLTRKNEKNPEKVFHINTFQNQLAVGTGIGIRADVTVFVLRFDISIPLRIPNLAENERWLAGKINFSNSSWRKENLAFNVAIGYPF